ncbi:MAG: LytTR family transcriptional regulator DNA-binding domain-containing protein [Tannerellaceae bacterium]|jgi:DNA-binding LytR/AlgR family response regulator|nr:LytTR family transcriptional regulator DNA-binding domain-containing protein [Tannerellaceae bacterium]
MEKYLILRTRDELLKVTVSQILYFEAHRTHCKLLLVGGIQFTIAVNIGKVEVLLLQQLEEESAPLVRLGKSYIVNKTHVLQINIPKQRLLLMDNGKPRELLFASKYPLRVLKRMLEKDMTPEIGGVPETDEEGEEEET